MSDIATLLTAASALWVTVAGLAVIVIGFTIGRKLIRKV